MNGAQYPPPAHRDEAAMNGAQLNTHHPLIAMKLRWAAQRPLIAMKLPMRTGHAQYPAPLIAMKLR